jgi:hypothetical protein
MESVVAAGIPAFCLEFLPQRCFLRELERLIRVKAKDQDIPLVSLSCMSCACHFKKRCKTIDILFVISTLKFHTIILAINILHARPLPENKAQH